jgi:hypothetical protein
MSRVIDRAQLAVTSDGDVVLNVAPFDVPKKVEEIVKMAGTTDEVCTAVRLTFERRLAA